MKAKRVVKKNKLQMFLLFIIVISFVILISAYLYFTYINIDIEDSSSNYKAERIVSTNSEETVDNIVSNSTKISDVLEKTMNSVVGISKLKETGSSIFSTNNENALGLGTGIIVSDNGYILSNEHVTR